MQPDAALYQDEVDGPYNDSKLDYLFESEGDTDEGESAAADAEMVAVAADVDICSQCNAKGAMCAQCSKADAFAVHAWEEYQAEQSEPPVLQCRRRRTFSTPEQPRRAPSTPEQPRRVPEEPHSQMLIEWQIEGQEEIDSGLRILKVLD